MAISFKSSATGDANPLTSTTITIPGDTATGDILVVSLGSRGIVQTPGFGVTDDDTGGNSWTRFANSASNTTEVWYKFATSGTESKTVTVTGANNSLAAVLKTFSGVDGPPVGDINETNAGTNQTHVGQTPSNPDSMFCFALGHYANDHDVTAMTSATAGSLTFTEHISTGGSDCAVALGHVGPTSANVGTVSWTTASATTTTRNSRSIGFFLEPLPSITGTLGGPPPEERLYPTNPGPHTEFSDPDQTQGVRFSSSSDGYILGAYIEVASPVPSGTLTMFIANSTTILQQKDITGTVASNWNRCEFDDPFAITAGVTYNLCWNYSGSGENRFTATAGVRTTTHLTTAAQDFLDNGLVIPTRDVNEDYWIDPIFVLSLDDTGLLSDVTISGSGTVADPGQGSLIFNTALNAYLPILVR